MFKRKFKSTEDEVVTPVVEEQPEEKASTVFDASVVQGRVQKLLKAATFEPPTRYWLNAGNEDLHAVLGHREKGIPYGKIIEIAGEESAGKTTLVLKLAALAQADGAVVGRIDLEDSRDQDWDSKQGLVSQSVYDIYPRLVVSKPAKDDDEEQSKKSKKKKKTIGGIPRLQSAEELFKEAEVAMAKLAEAGFKKQFWMLDSIANLQTEMAIEAGVDSNMRTRNDRPMFLSDTLPRWAALAANYNAMIVLINQVRDKQGLVFGDPRYTPGGRALKHNCSVQAWVLKKSKGVIKDGDGVAIGMAGYIVNRKNKLGPREAKCGFKIKWRKTPAVWSFMAKDEVE